MRIQCVAQVSGRMVSAVSVGQILLYLNSTVASNIFPEQ